LLEVQYSPSVALSANAKISGQFKVEIFLRIAKAVFFKLPVGFLCYVVFHTPTEYFTFDCF
jgi:hypothetical protein